MNVVALVLAPVLMSLVSVLERRLGPSAAGWGAALPITLIVSVAAVTARSGMDVGSKVGLSAAAHVPAQVLFAIAFAHVLWRHGLVVGITAGVTAYGAGAVVISLVPPLMAAGLGVVAVAAGPRLMPQVPIRPGPQRSWLITAASCAIASLAVAAVLVVTRISGPGMAGMIAAYPSMCTLLTITLAPVRSRRRRARPVRTRPQPPDLSRLRPRRRCRRADQHRRRPPSRAARQPDHGVPHVAARTDERWTPTGQMTESAVGSDLRSRRHRVNAPWRKVAPQGHSGSSTRMTGETTRIAERRVTCDWVGNTHVMKARNRPGLTRERIVDTAIQLAGTEGLESVSMRRIGKELGVEPMSLYHYVPSRRRSSC